MRRRVHSDQTVQGYDSFLDIVANLVGILIILVMVVGARAKDAMQHADVEAEPAVVPSQDLRTTKHAEVSVRQELQDSVRKLKRQKFEIEYRRTERDRMLARIVAAEQALAAETQQLDGRSQRAHELLTELDQAKRDLEQLRFGLEAAQQSEAPVKIIQHRPTPLAQTVFGREVHFRLKGGRLVFVPIDTLVDKFKDEAKQKVWKLRQSPRITETVGPIGGFRLKYTLKRAEYTLDTQLGPAVQQRVELDHFVLVPVRDDLGEPLEIALEPASEFRSILGQFDANQATVTVWVYPDSYAEFRRLKEVLFRQGYLTASRPLPEGQPISGSPNGTHSFVQ
jgi:hypothetical protein